MSSVLIQPHTTCFFVNAALTLVTAKRIVHHMAKAGLPDAEEYKQPIQEFICNVTSYGTAGIVRLLWVDAQTIRVLGWNPDQPMKFQEHIGKGVPIMEAFCGKGCHQLKRSNSHYESSLQIPPPVKELVLPQVSLPAR